MEFEGYQVLDHLHQGRRHNIFRAKRIEDGLNVILKVPVSSHPSASETAATKKDFETALSLSNDCPFIVAPLSLVSFGSIEAIVTEDFGGDSIAKAIPEDGMPIQTFLSYAIQLCDALDAVHSRNIVHQDISTSNMILNREMSVVKLTDFASSIQLDNELSYKMEPTSPIPLSTLPFVAPEQTGRVSTPVSFYSDFYSLGVSFYQMLSGSLPFTAVDNIEMVHSHIAKVAPTLTGVDPMIALIIKKLMMKAPEQRYQTAQGLKADLVTCMSYFDKKRKLSQGNDAMMSDIGDDVIPSFELGSRDFAIRLVSQHSGVVFGRAAEEKSLQEVADQVFSGARSKVVFVSGPPGIGKSTTIYHALKKYSFSGTHIISGKFDQFVNKPYKAILDCVELLVAKVTRDTRDEELTDLRAQLRAKVGGNASLLVQAIPASAPLLGAAANAPLDPLPPAESRNRFQRLILDVLKLFLESYTIFMVVDDIQWADQGSLDLFGSFVNECASRLLLVLSYRNTSSDLPPDHPLHKAIADMTSKKNDLNTSVGDNSSTFTFISLYPLSISSVADLILYCLNGKYQGSFIPLAEIVHQITNGNPFFTMRFLSRLIKEGALTLDRANNCWNWDTSVIERIAFTANVVEFLADSIQQLPIEAQRVLQVGAIVGNVFSLTDLCFVLVRPTSRYETEISKNFNVFGEAKVNQALSTCIQEDLIEKVGNKYKFTHDRVHQGAYMMTTAEEKEWIHYTLGYSLLATVDGIESRLFETVGHLNCAVAYITDINDKLRLCKLNLTSGQNAQLAGAFDHACACSAVGVHVLSTIPNAWVEHYTLTMSLHLLAVESEYVCRNFDAALRLYDAALEHSVAPEHRATLLGLKVRLLTNEAKYVEAMKSGKEGCRALGFAFLDAPSQGDLVRIMDKVEQSVPEHKIMDLMNLPEMQDPNSKAVMVLLSEMLVSAYFSDPLVFVYIVYNMVAMCIEKGNTPAVGPAYGFFAMNYVGVYGRSPTWAHRLGKLALKLSSKYNVAIHKSTMMVVYASVLNFWKHNAITSYNLLKTAFQMCIGSGDMLFGSYSTFYLVLNRWFTGDSLEKVLREAEFSYEFQMNIAKTPDTYNFVRGIVSASVALMTPLQLKPFSNSPILKAIALPAEASPGTAPACTSVWVSRMFLMEEPYAESIEDASKCEVAKSLPGLLYVPLYSFYYCLYLLRAFRNGVVPASDITARMEDISKNMQILEKWSQGSPTNFQQMNWLVQAEWARHEKRIPEAMELYEKATESAGFIQLDSIVCEVSGDFYLEQKVHSFAKVLLERAVEGYTQWGALRKVEVVKSKYPAIFTVLNPRKQSISPNVEFGILDLTSMAKSFNLLSKEMKIESLLRKSLQLIMENAGAEKGYLIQQTKVNAIADKKFCITVSWDVSDGDVAVHSPAVPLEDNLVSIQVVNNVHKSRKSVLIRNPAQDADYSADPYIQSKVPMCILCVPLFYNDVLKGIVYLEHFSIPEAFSSHRMYMIELLTAQVAISLENARLYDSVLLSQKEAEQANVAKDNLLLLEKAARLKTQESEERTRVIIEIIPHMVWCTTPQGTCEFANSRWIDYTGVDLNISDTEIVHVWETLVHPEQRQFVIEEWKNCLESGQPFNAQYQFLNVNGEFKWVISMALPLRDPQNPNIILKWFGTCTDIDSQKQAEQEMAMRIEAESREKRYKTLAEAIPQMVWTALSTGEIDYINQQWAEYTGLSFAPAIMSPQSSSRSSSHPSSAASSAVPSPCTTSSLSSPSSNSAASFPIEIPASTSSMLWDYITAPLHPDDVPLFNHRWRSALEHGEVFEAKFRFRRRDGVFRWHLVRAIPEHSHSKGDVLKWFGTCTDIDDQVVAINELAKARIQAERATQLKSQFLANQSHEIRTPLNGLLGMLHLLLDTEMTAYQRTCADTMQQSAEGLLSVINDILDFSRIEAGQTMKLQNVTFNVERLVEHVSDSLLPLAVHKKIELNYFVHPSVPQLVVGDAMRLRQILVNLVGNGIKFTEVGEIFVECYLVTPNNDTKVKEKHTKKHMLNPRHLKDKIRQKLKLKSKEVVSEINLDETPRSPSFQLADVNTSSIDLTVQDPNNNNENYSNSPQIEQEGADQRMSDEKEVRLHFRVIDTGCGITQDQIEYLFQPFFQVDSANTRKYGGSGLGLTITKELVRVLGGNKISVASTPGHGSTFQFDVALRSVVDDEESPPVDKDFLARPPQSPLPTSSEELLCLLCVSGKRTCFAIHNHLDSFNIKHQTANTLEEVIKIMTNPLYKNKKFAILIDLLYAGGAQLEAFFAFFVNNLTFTNPTAIIFITTPGVEGSIKLQGLKTTFANETSPSFPLNNPLFVSKPLSAYKLHESMVKILSNTSPPPVHVPLTVNTTLPSSPPASSSPPATPTAVTLPVRVPSGLSAIQNLALKIEEQWINKNRVLRVMVAEDNVVNQKVIKRHLEKIHAVVEIANDGQQAVDMVKKNGASHFSLLVLDLAMPNKDGLAAMQEIREFERLEGAQRVPAVAVTANIMPEVEDKCTAAGFSGYISKPVDYQKFATVLTSLLIP